jgi:uncharacterized protein Veg
LTGKSVSKVKGMVEDCVGQKVKFKVKKGKSRSLICEGIISDTYPAVFTVSVDNKGLKRVLSFNYIDILTNYVEFFLCNEEETRIM